MPRVATPRTRSCSLGPRQIHSALSRRRADHSNDELLDFGTQILGMLWLEDNAEPLQVILYPREDLRVRLSDHKIALGAAGFEKGPKGIQVYVRDPLRNGGQGGWLDCNWETPLRNTSAKIRWIIPIVLCPNLCHKAGLATVHVSRNRNGLATGLNSRDPVEDLTVDLRTGECSVQLDQLFSASLSRSDQRLIVSYDRPCQFQCNRGKHRSAYVAPRNANPTDAQRISTRAETSTEEASRTTRGADVSNSDADGP
ncbi:hypothetical protein B0H17DRAFT_1144000 [Mycena rosella]|uniref:Uncharacterized protein n=1 Tax=Mycena rosella TaxID=1033263 RepID=A0AAD7G671_MYCRO|nr:hypothetical protein B0H17DRAFT_1144000 [Mycena rosella]